MGVPTALHRTFPECTRNLTEMFMEPYRDVFKTLPTCSWNLTEIFLELARLHAVLGRFLTLESSSPASPNASSPSSAAFRSSPTAVAASEVLATVGLLPTVSPDLDLWEGAAAMRAAIALNAGRDRNIVRERKTRTRHAYSSVIGANSLAGVLKKKFQY